ncbi:MAG: hypothetical protein H7123_00960 [Thermoleophilia bacterium]|nr:hypothetical protein [Thermoleophilia bacterium]
MRLLQVSDSFLGEVPFGIAALGDDLWRGFAAAIDQAIAAKVDMFVHAGQLIGAFTTVDAVAERICGELDRLAAADIAVVLHDDATYSTGGDDLGLLGHATVSADHGTNVIVRGVGFGAGLTAATPAAQNVSLVRAAVIGMPATDRMAPPLDALDLAASAPRWDWIGLSGCTRAAMVEPTAWYSGQTAPLDTRDSSHGYGLLIDLNAAVAVNRLCDVVRWQGRPHCNIRVVCQGVTNHELAAIVDARVAQAAALEADWNGTVVELDLDARGTEMTLESLLEQIPAAIRLLHDCVYAQLRWNGTARPLPRDAQSGSTSRPRKS